MFKKPPSELKTSAPIRSSDRRKLRQRVLQSFPVLQAEEGDVLVPDGLQLQKFSTHLDEPGVAYLSPEGDPLWFTIGKGSDDLIPTVYTLWKRPDLLPFVSTPAPVVPKLVGGADLMIPGDLLCPKQVVQHSPALAPDQLVSVTQYHRGAIGPPLAVGTMAVSSDTLRSAEETDVKGKAVYVLHTWKDALWEMGPSKKTEVPAPRELKTSEADVPDDADGDLDVDARPNETARPASEELDNKQPDAETKLGDASPEAGSSTSTAKLTPEDVSSILRAALLQAISTSLSGLPPSSFPMTASTFWSTYVLPARPAYALGTYGLADSSAIDVKQSTFKNVKTFLKNSAKDGLIKIKETKSDVMVTAVFPKHPDAAGHHSHRTVGDIEARAKKAEIREKEEREAEEKRKGEFQVAELWQPSGTTVPFFVAAGKDTSGFYNINDIKTITTDYISSHRLINANDQQYINVGSDEALAGVVSVKGKDTPEFMKRDEVLKLVRAHMQAWHQITADGRDIVRKKGEMKPVSVVVKIRQGRKACTLITGFEPFGLEAEEIADELRRICASSTTVTPIHGKPNALEVMVQGKQIKNVTEFLLARGIPKSWVASSDQASGKKK